MWTQAAISATASYWCTGGLSCSVGDIMWRSHWHGTTRATRMRTRCLSITSAPEIASNDYHLQAGSPAIARGNPSDHGRFRDAGSGTSLVVNDAAYFQDGYGLSNAYSTVHPDCIAVGTASNHVCVTAVNYSTNTLTLASSISRSVGEGVYSL